jgi:hypothetical protein
MLNLIFENYSSAKHPEVDVQVKQWIDKKRGEGAAINGSEIICKALQVSEAENLPLKGSRGWLYRFLLRNKLSLRFEFYF